MMKNEAKVKTEDWDMLIRPKKPLFYVDLVELWKYRDLLQMFVKRDIITVYKQTILGPIWYVLQPILTSLIYMFVFSGIAGISTDGVPQILFYLSGVTIWNYFAESFNTTSKTFKENANIFGKVYFPRLIMPLSKVFSSLIKFAIQLLFFLVVFFYYYFFEEGSVKPNITLLLLPLYVLLMATLGFGFGILFTSLTVKYRDLTFLIQFGVQLVMYASPVIYPMSAIPDEFKNYVMFNPLSSILEGFKYSFLGAGVFDWSMLLYSFVFAIVALICGVLVFNRTERNFIDTV